MESFSKIAKHIRWASGLEQRLKPRVIFSRGLRNARNHAVTMEAVSALRRKIVADAPGFGAFGQGTHTTMTSPFQDHLGIRSPSGTSSAEWWYRAIVVVVAQAK